MTERERAVRLARLARRVNDRARTERRLTRLARVTPDAAVRLAAIRELETLYHSSLRDAGSRTAAV